MKKNLEQPQERETKRMRVLGEASRVNGKIVKEWILPPGEGLGLTVKKDQVLRIIDLEGQQVVDFVCFNANDKDEKLWIGATIECNGNVFMKKGYGLYSVYLNKMFTLIEDTCGVHDMLIGQCSPDVYEKFLGTRDHKNCAENFMKALAPYGLKRRDIPMNLNVFMDCPIAEDGGYKIDFPKSQRGDFVDLKADMDCIVAMSCCPGDGNPCNGYYPTQVKIILYEQG